ncbi:hypothetical protein RND81_05G222400 [Saponaria officinalis]|uniref:Uncharacterized protein n=3 Tax=Saponaria officinalis TaxID=3572 RepID=A0AAW1L307_SAPOF
MHGFGLGSTVLVNAEVDSMGGIVDVGDGIGTKPSPRRAAIEKAQAELRLEYDVREERRRELEFLEKGGDPLDFKFGHAASVSVQSTSHTDQHADQNLTSEAKGSFALTASPHGDSVESSGRLGLTVACEPNSADNFDGENETHQNDRTSMRPGRCSITPSEHFSQIGVCKNVKDSEDSLIFHPKKGQAYKRRNRFKTNCDGSRSNSADMASSGGHISTHARNLVHSKLVASENQLDKESNDTHRLTESADGNLNLSNSKEKLEEVENLSFKVDDAPVSIRIIEPDTVIGKASIDNVDAGCPPFGAEKKEDNATSSHLNETSMINGDNKCTQTDALAMNAPVTMKGLDSESSCTQANVSVDGNGNNDSDLCPNLQNVDRNGVPKEPTLPVEEISVSRDDTLPNEEHITNAMEMASCIKKDKDSINLQENGCSEENHAEILSGNYSLHNSVKGVSNVEGQEAHTDAEIKSETDLSQLDDHVSKMESSCPVRPLVDCGSGEVNKNGLTGPSPALESQPSVENQPKPPDKAHEDRILEEAQMIEAKRKRIAELSISLLPREERRKCHWDLVLEEMAWLANDFAQERLWKMTAAAQICRRIAFASRIRLEEQSKFLKQKSVAHALAKAVMEFWHSVRLSVENTGSSAEICKHESLSEIRDMDKPSEDVLQSTGRKQDRAVYGYAVRFLQYNCSLKPSVEAPGVTDIPCDVDLPEIAWQDRFTEENLFYAIPPGAMEMYRKSIESHLAECERVGNNIHEEVDTSGQDAVGGCGYEDNDYEEDEGENMYYMPGASETVKPSKKKWKNKKSNAARSYEFGGDFGYGHSAETRNGTSQLNIIGKRPANNLHVDPIPTKRMRTASRQRVVGPLGAGSAGFTPVLSRADGSSGDTNSFQDDQSALHGGTNFPRGSEVDSAMNFEKQSKFDSAEMSAKPKKKKKIKHQNVSYDQRWQLDSSMPNEQKELVRKRLDNHQLESNGNGGLFGQHAKRPKLAKHPLDNLFDNTAPMSGSVASPVASQMSNMSSQTKIIKFIGGRDRGKKGKGLKMSSGQLGSGSPWTIVEDQALVVLVHDMGPNWELVSDAINNILQFKCIFRKPQECKERHKFLMDKPCGDGADSAEDSGSSQPYPSTLPGIPKGSARQLFRSLHAHVEEDNIKSRFEKIIRIEQQHFRKKKGLRQIAAIHGSHALSLSQVIPNNLNGGVLTPLDLCDTATSNHDPLAIASQSSHSGGSSLPNQSNILPIHSPSGLNSPIQGFQGSPSMGIGNNLASPPSQLPSSRDARYSIPRSGSLPIEEQQRLHQYNSMVPGRNVQASTLSSSGSIPGSDRSVRMHPGGNGASMTPLVNRSIPSVRPGVQGISSMSMLDSGSALPSNMGGSPSNMIVHPGTSPSHGNIMYRPRDSLHNVRTSEQQRQTVLPEMQMKTTQINSVGVPALGDLGSGFSNQIASSPLPTYAGRYQHLSRSNHAATPEQQAYIRAARERQMQQQQQRLLQRQHQQHPASSASMTRVQTQSQLPMSSPLQSSSKVQSSSSSQPLPLPSPTPSSPLTHVVLPPHQQQKSVQGHGLGGQSGPGGMINQGGKQRQQYQQSSRQHPQQRQQSQPHQAKLVKGGRSNMLTHQNLPVDPSHLNGVSAKTASQVSGKGDPALNLMQDQNLYPGSSVNTMPSSKTLASTASPSHIQPQKQCIDVGSATSKPVQQMSSHLEGVSHGQAQGVPSPTASGSNQDPSSSVVHSRKHQPSQQQPPTKAVNQHQPALQRTNQQNRQVNSDSLTKSQVDHYQAKQKSLSVGPPSACVNPAVAVPVTSSVSTVVRKVQDPARESITASAPSPSDPVTKEFGNKPLSSVSQGLVQRQSSGNNLVSRGVESQWQQQESQLQPPPLQPKLPQNQSQQ